MQNGWYCFANISRSTRYQDLQNWSHSRFRPSKEISRFGSFIWGPHISENYIQCLIFLHIPRDWWWSNGWNWVSWLCLILWTFSIVWILIYTLGFWKKKKKTQTRCEWAKNTVHPPIFFCPLLSTCMQRWVVGNGGIASTSIPHLEAAKCLFSQNLYWI